MKPITLSIIYDKPIYHATETLNGHLCVTFHKRLDIKKIKVKVIGKGKVRWTETTGTGDDKREDIYTNSEKYVDQRIVLFNSAVKEAMNPGEYSYPFTVLLPTPLPETFESKSGKVLYYCKASIKTHPSVALFAKNKYKEKVPFTVHASVPLDLLGGFSEMPFVSRTDELPWGCCCCCCISSGKLSTSVNLNKKGYIPGEDIIINAEISNQTTELLSLVQATLEQKIICVASGGQTDTVTNEITQIRSLDTIAAHSDFVWRNAVMKLPTPLPATNLGGCNIIKVEYTVEVAVGEDSGCCAPKEKYKLPILIGSGMLSNTMFSDTMQFGAFAPSAPPVITTQPGYGFKSDFSAPMY